jgi:hypothetical protein
MTRHSVVFNRALACIEAYEEWLRDKHSGKYQRANRTWPMFARYSAEEAVARCIMRPGSTDGLKALAAKQQLHLSFEQIAIDLPCKFNSEIVQRARENLAAVAPEKSGVAGVRRPLIPASAVSPVHR